MLLSLHVGKLFISYIAEVLNERVLKKLADIVYNFLCNMSDEDLLQNVAELNRVEIFRFTM